MMPYRNNVMDPNMDYDTLKANRDRMSQDLARRYGPKLPATLRRIFLSSSCGNVDEFKAWVEEDPPVAIEQMLQWVGVGQVGVERLLALLDIQPPKYEDSLVGDAVHRIYHEHQLDPEDVSLLRKLIAAQLSICPEGDVAEQLLRIRDKL